MHKITLICVGSIKSHWIAEGCREYLGRLHHDLRCEIIELPASKERDPLRQKEEESKRILDALEKREGNIWVLDEAGKQVTSPQFALALSKFFDAGQSAIFVIGGAYGLDRTVHTRAERTLSLSAMTLPHELCRLVFLEQLYRALQIHKGTGYHH